MQGWQARILNEHVTGLAVAARQRDGRYAVVVHAVRQQRLVQRAVQRWPNVVRHPAVERGIATNPRHVLDRPYGVQGDPGLPHDRSPRLDDHPWMLEPQVGRDVPHGATDRPRHLVGLHWIVFVRVGDAPAATRTEFLKGQAVAIAHASRELQHRLDRLQVGRHLEHLRTDVSVEPDNANAL